MPLLSGTIQYFADILAMPRFGIQIAGVCLKIVATDINYKLLLLIVINSDSGAPINRMSVSSFY